MFVDFLQVLSFPFASVFPWNPAWTDWLSTATRITRFHWYLEISTGLTNAIFFIALAAVLLVLMNAGYVGVAFSRRKPMNMILVRILLRDVTLRHCALPASDRYLQCALFVQLGPS
eukprot:Opistho-2@45315